VFEDGPRQAGHPPGVGAGSRGGRRGLKRLFLRGLQSAARRLAPALYGPVTDAIGAMRAAQAAAERNKWQSCGIGVQVSPSAQIVHPRGMAVGHDVVIGDEAIIDAQGGVLIGDGVRIGTRAVLLSSSPVSDAGDLAERRLASIEIGAGAILEPRVTVQPGTRIGGGAVVSAGTVVSGEIAPGSIVAPPSPVVIGQREAVKPLRPRVCPQPDDIAFVLTTGRSGSTALADILNNHPKIQARHEPRMQFIAWSTQFARGEIDMEEMTRRLRVLFLDASAFDSAFVHVESDQKYFNLVNALYAVLPKAKFIWLTRSADAVIASTYARGWYRENEPGDFFEQQVYWAWRAYRITGPDTGKVSFDDWVKMDSFEKNAWYWAHVNRTIWEDLAQLPREQWMWVDIDTITARLPGILEFLGVEITEIPEIQSNASSYGRHYSSDWTAAQRQSYERHCGSLMREIYEERAFA